MKYKIKFHCKQPRQSHIEGSPRILIPHDWHCSVDFWALSFSFFVWQLAMCNWNLLLCSDPVNRLSLCGTGSYTKKHLSLQLHAGCQAIQNSSLHMWKIQDFCQVPAEVIWRCAWNIWIIFQTPQGFPIDPSFIQHIR